MNQRDPSPCCGRRFVIFSSIRKVMCPECRREYKIDYISGDLINPEVKSILT